MSSKPVLKVVAVASSLLFVGAFVAYRAGAFDRFWRPTEGSFDGAKADIMGGSKSDGMFGDDAAPATTSSEGELSAEETQKIEMFFSTKSAPVFDDVNPTFTTPPAYEDQVEASNMPRSPNDRTIQPGSKAMVLDIYPPTTNAPPPPVSQLSDPPKLPDNGQPPAASTGNSGVKR
jgi:hypothetical protein